MRYCSVWRSASVLYFSVRIFFSLNLLLHHVAPRRQHNRRIFQATTHLRFVAKVHLLFFRDPTPFPRSSLLDLTMADTRECVIHIPYPSPAVYSCPICHMAFKQALKHLQIAKHVVEKHPGYETKLTCAMCNAEFRNARSAGRHKCEGETLKMKWQKSH